MSERLIAHAKKLREIHAAGEEWLAGKPQGAYLLELAGEIEAVVKAKAGPGGKFGFGEALAHLEAGRRVARDGWNGKGMFVYLVPAASYPVQTGAAKAHFGEGSLVPYRPYFALKTAQDDVATWQPSVGDALAKDWFCLDPVAEDGDIVADGKLRVTVTVSRHTHPPKVEILTGVPPHHPEYASMLLEATKAIMAEPEIVNAPPAPFATVRGTPGFHRYRSHKVVEAAEIHGTYNPSEGDVPPHALLSDGLVHPLPAGIFARGVPNEGDFLVRYNAGTDKEYLSWSPRDVFMDGYTRIDGE